MFAVFFRFPRRTPARRNRRCALLALLALFAIVPRASEARAVDTLHLPRGSVRTQLLPGWTEAPGPGLQLGLGFRQEWSRGRLAREVPGAAVGGYTARPVARALESTSRLILDGEMGLAWGLALTARVPVTLFRSRRLEPRRGVGRFATEGAAGQSLFLLPSESTPRSGVDYLAFGTEWTSPVGVSPRFTRFRLGFEGRFSASRGMKASTRGRLGAPSGSEAADSSSSRGTTGLRVRGVVSQRFRHLEPFVSAAVVWERPTRGSAFARGEAAPPLPRASTVALGAEIIGWELAERFQQLSLELTASFRHVTRGQDYSVLFDALGTSPSQAFNAPQPTRYVENPDALERSRAPFVPDFQSPLVSPTGILEVDAHGRADLEMRVRWRAGRYVRFELYGAFGLTQGHTLTLASRCSPARSLQGPSPSCLAEGAGGQPNPHFRPEIHEPGHRYRLDSGMRGSAGGTAVVLF